MKALCTRRRLSTGFASAALPTPSRAPAACVWLPDSYLQGAWYAAACDGPPWPCCGCTAVQPTLLLCAAWLTGSGHRMVAAAGASPVRAAVRSSAEPDPTGRALVRAASPAAPRGCCCVPVPGTTLPPHDDFSAVVSVRDALPLVRRSSGRVGVDRCSRGAGALPCCKNGCQHAVPALLSS